ncbi:MAG: NADH-quinone oxidoreductase subunit N [Elusimicrobiota bacterium]
MENLYLLYPEIALSVCALALLMADLWWDKARGKLLYHLGILAACVSLGILGIAFSSAGHFQKLGTLWAVDPLAMYFKVLILATTILVLALANEYRPAVRHGHLGSFTALLLLSAAGMMLLVSATNFLLIFLSLELVSITSFILVGYEYREMKSAEGAIKYFLIGAFSSAIMVYGISLFYGAAGTTQLSSMPLIMNPGTSVMFITSCLLILVGFGFKVSLVPFHFWVPDAYEGAPTPVTTFLSIAPKIAGLAVMLRVFTHFIPHGAMDLTFLLSVLAVLTMTVGNLTAIFQHNVKRLLAYSSIAQAGYMLIGFVTGDLLGREGILLYSMVYVFMNVGAFSVVILLGNEEGYEIEAYDGLARRSLGLALAMAFFMLSLAGIPPLAGFVAKLYLFAAAVQSHFYWLAVIAVLNSVVSVYYYMRIVYHMFFKEARTERPVEMGYFISCALALSVIAIFAIGIFPEVFISAAQASSEMFPKNLAAIPSVVR